MYVFWVVIVGCGDLVVICMRFGRSCDGVVVHECGWGSNGGGVVAVIV